MQVNQETNNNTEKIYRLGGIEYRLKPLDLDFLNAIAPFRTALNKNIYLHSGSLDMSDVHQAQDNIETLRIARGQLLELLEEPDITPESKADAEKRMPELANRIELLEDELSNDRYLQNLIKLNASCTASAYEETITDLPMIKTLFHRILIGDLKNITVENLNKIESLPFVLEVCTDAINFYRLSSLK